MPRPARRFATFHGLWGLDEAVLALPAATITDSRSPLRASANIAGFIVASGKQRVCVPIVAFSELSKPRRCGSQPPRDAMAASSSEAVMLPLTTLKHPQRRQAAPDQATVPTAAGAPRPPQSKQLFGRRTSLSGQDRHPEMVMSELHGWPVLPLADATPARSPPPAYGSRPE